MTMSGSPSSINKVAGQRPKALEDLISILTLELDAMSGSPSSINEVAGQRPRELEDLISILTLELDGLCA
eukprot:scaffold1389_cov176-Skeletonema_marinoi.AAC.4